MTVLGPSRRRARGSDQGDPRRRFTPWRSAVTAAGWRWARACRRARAWCGFIPSGRYAHPRFHGPRRRRLRGRSSTRRRTARLGLVRPDRPPLELGPRVRPDGVFRGHSDFVIRVAIHVRRPFGLSAAKDRTIKRINSRTFKEERTYSEHNEEVLAVAAHPDGKRFVSAGAEPQIRWWSIDGDDRNRARTVTRARCISSPLAATAAG